MDCEETIFEHALRLSSPLAREAYLRRACAGDASMLERLQGLLGAHDRAGGFLEHPQPAAGASGLDLGAVASAAGGTMVLPLTEKLGDRIGRYRLLEKIGEGGCGVVYMAEQEEPVRRRVALKVIKLGMDTESVIARFEAERQALALMDHPNIAKVFDAGATESPHNVAQASPPASSPGVSPGVSSGGETPPKLAGGDACATLSAGRPYFVMELVRGTKITEFCDHNHLPTSERLALFMQVCRAIQHAHQKGIIHRDIKPSNILVTLHDGVPVPKVIDFGIAKATQGRLTDKTVFTAFQQFIGTPAYMSPEQAEMSGLDIDTRSDIYSLGVLLYELLTGKTPFDSKELLEAGLDAMRRTIREREPERPSTKLSTMVKGELTTTANRRQTEPPKLVHAVRGDLDWIVMKALEKDRARRYETANGLAVDIQRHMNNEPVVACPPSNLYKLQKLVRRNKGAVAAAGIILVLLLAGVGASTWEALRARRAEQEQVRLRRQAQNNENQAQASERKAKTEAAKSKQVAQFLKDMLKGVGPSVALGRDTKLLREILDKTVERVGKDLTNEPEAEAELRSVIGNTYVELADYPKAEEMQRQALQLRKARFGETNDLVAASLNDLGVVLVFEGRYAEAEPILRTALAMRMELFGKENLDVATSLHNLAHLIANQGNDSEAETLHRQALELQRRLAGNESPEVALTLTRLVPILRRQGKLAEAESFGRQAVALFKKLYGNDHPEVARALGRLADALSAQGNLPEAETMLREALAMQTKLLGGQHPLVAVNIGFLANVLRAQGKVAEVESLYDEWLQSVRGRLPADDPGLATALATRAGTLLQEAKFAEAEVLARECLAIRQTKLPDEWLTFNARSMLGGSLLGQRKYAEAEPLLLSGYEGMKQREDKIPADSKYFRLTEALQRLVQLYEAMGRPDQAAQWKTKVTQWYRKSADSGNVAALNDLAWHLATCVDSAIRDGPNAVTFAEKAVVATKRKDPQILDTLAAAYAETGEFAKAVSIQNEAIALLPAGAVKGDFASHLKLYESNRPYREPTFPPAGKP